MSNPYRPEPMPCPDCARRHAEPRPARARDSIRRALARDSVQAIMVGAATIIAIVITILVVSTVISHLAYEERGHCYINNQALRMPDSGEDLLLVTDVKPGDAERFARLMNCLTFNGRQLPESIPPAP